MKKRDVGGKKATLLYMLELFQEAAGAGEELSQQDIKERLEEVDVCVTENTIRDNLKLLQAFYPDLQACGSTKFGHKTNWALQTEDMLDMSQAYFLMALVQSARRITTKERNDLLRKLRSLAPSTEGTHFVPLREDLRKPSEVAQARTYRFFSNLQVISEAIERGLIISFDKGEIDENGRLQKSTKEDSHFEVAPYGLATMNDSTYLVGFRENHQSTQGSPQDKLYIDTVELLENVEIMVDEKGRAKRAVDLRSRKGFEVFDFNHYLDTHLFAFSDPITSITLRGEKCPSAYKALYTTFGDALTIEDDPQDPKYLLAYVQANEIAMQFWALLYVDLFEVVDPEPVRLAVQKALTNGLARYQQEVATD